MARPLEIDEFAKLAKLPVETVKELAHSGIFDHDRDGLFDEYDAAKLWLVGSLLDEGRQVAEIPGIIAKGEAESRIPFIGKYLFPDFGNALSLDEVASEVGLTPEQLEELRTAVGFAGPRLFTKDDVESFRAAKMTLDAGLPWKAIVEVTRVWGDAMRRVARTEVGTLENYVFKPASESNTSEAAVRRDAVLSVLSQIVQPLLDSFHRQYLLKEAANGAMHDLLSASGTPPPAASEATIAFVDLTSFTMLAQIQGDQTAAEVLDRFDSKVRSLVLRHDGSLVKQIGDAFMLVFDESANAVRFAIALTESTDTEGDLLAPRIGIHAGPVVYQVGDYVGNTVNLASRVTTEAMPNEILVTEPVAQAAARAGIDTSPVGVRALRGSSEPLTLHRVKATRAPAARDPVCGKAVGEDAAARLVRNGEVVLFDSEECLRSYLAEPARYQAG